MATAVLKHVKKIYPLQDDQKKKRKKGEEPAKKNNLQITEDGVVAVQDFNLEIADKEFIVLVGPSGCGKSTTLRMIAGLEDITDGDFYIDGKRVNDIAARDRDISMVFQNYALYPHMSVYDNIAFPLKMRHVPKDEIDRKVKEAAEILNITEYLDRKPRNMSGGQRQRVAIGRAIVREPKLLLMDEPLSNLDAKLRNQMRAEIIKLRKKINTTFVYVTHDQTEAMTLGDRIVIMCDGFIQQIGTPQEVFDHPSNLFVAEFIGTPKMNIFAGMLTKKDGFQLTCQKADITISDRIQKQLENGNPYTGEVLIGCRPEHIYLTEKGPNAIKATVDVCEMMGSELHLHVSVEKRDVIVRVQTVDLDEKHKSGFQFGEEVYLAFQPDLIHLFHPETKENLI